MKMLINEVENLREKCSRYGDEANSMLKGSLLGTGSGCFGMIFNHATLTLELLDHYYRIWRKPTIITTRDIEDLERSKKENAERCILITKWLFIDSISSIEFSMKESIKLCPNTLFKKKGKRVYLSSIVKKSKSIHLMGNDSIKAWNLILRVRNLVVHNNAIADQNGQYQIKDITISLIEGKMMKGKLDFFVKLTDMAVDEYYSWLKAFEQCVKNGQA